jgi:amino acid transporter
MTPALLGSIVLVLLAAGVAFAAHAYRKKLPKPMRQSWRRHHGLYKALGMASFALILITLYGGGQI